jgi:flavin-dependent dehydrogenase
VVATEEADVIVVGSGPGGAACAYHLARHGAKVLLLEKSEFPREKVCGDGLTPRAVKQIVGMGIDTTTPGWTRNRGLRVIGGGIRLELDWPDLTAFPNYGLTRTRMDFDELLARAATDAGAKLLTSTNVTAPVFDDRTGRVVGVAATVGPDKEPQEFRAPIIVSADGVSGRFPLALGLPSARTGRSGWPCAGTTAAPATWTTTWSRGSSCAARTTPASCCPAMAGSSGWVTAG